MGCYRLIEHTADLGIMVWGSTLKELFINAASAMYDIISDIGFIKSESSFSVALDALDRDELLRNWLSELLYYFNIKDTLLASFNIESISDTQIVSSASGEKIDRTRHKLKHEIKAVTFHNLNIRQSDLGLQTDIIFDI